MAKSARKRAARAAKSNRGPEVPDDSAGDVSRALERARAVDRQHEEGDAERDRTKVREERARSEELLASEIAQLLSDREVLSGEPDADMNEDDRRNLDVLRQEIRRKLVAHGVDPDHPESVKGAVSAANPSSAPVAEGPPAEHTGPDLNNESVRGRIALERVVKELESGTEQEKADAAVLRTYRMSGAPLKADAEVLATIRKYNRRVFALADSMRPGHADDSNQARNVDTSVADAHSQHGSGPDTASSRTHVLTKPTWNPYAKTGPLRQNILEKHKKPPHAHENDKWDRTMIEVAPEEMERRLPEYVKQLETTNPGKAELLRSALASRAIIGTGEIPLDGSGSEEDAFLGNDISQRLVQEAEESIRDQILAEKVEEEATTKRFSGQFDEGYGAKAERREDLTGQVSNPEGVKILSTKEIMELLESRSLNLYDKQGDRRAGYEIEKIYQRNGVRLAQVITAHEGGAVIIPLDELLEANDIVQPKLAGVEQGAALEALARIAEKEHVGPLVRDFFENNRTFSELTPEGRAVIARVYQLAYNAPATRKREVRALIPQTVESENPSQKPVTPEETKKEQDALTRFRSFEEIAASFNEGTFWKTIKNSRATKIALGIVGRMGASYALRELTGVTGIPSAIDIAKYGMQQLQLNGPRGLANAMAKLVTIERDGALSDRSAQRKKFYAEHGEEFKRLMALENQHRRDPQNARPLTKEELNRLYELKTLRSPTSARFAEIEKKLELTRGGGNQRGSDQRRLIAQQIWEMRNQTDHTEKVLRKDAQGLISKYLETKVNGVQAARAALNVALLTAATQTGIPWVANSKVLSTMVPYIANSRVLNNGVFDILTRKRDAELSARIHNKVGEKIVAKKSEKGNFQQRSEEVLWQQAMTGAVRDNIKVFFRGARRSFDPVQAEKNQKELNAQRRQALINISSYALTAGGSQVVAKIWHKGFAAAHDFFQHHFDELKQTYNPTALHQNLNVAIAAANHKVVDLRDHLETRAEGSQGDSTKLPPAQSVTGIRVSRGSTDSVRSASEAPHLASRLGSKPLQPDLVGYARQHPEVPMVKEILSTPESEKLLAPGVTAGAAEQAAANSDRFRSEVARVLGGRDDYKRLLGKVGRTDRDLVVALRKFMEQGNIKDPVEGLRRMSRASGLERVVTEADTTEIVRSPSAAESLIVTASSPTIDTLPAEATEGFVIEQGNGNFTWANPHDARAVIEVHEKVAANGASTTHVEIKPGVDARVASDNVITVESTEPQNQASLHQAEKEFSEKFSVRERRDALDWAKSVSDDLYPGASHEEIVGGELVRSEMLSNGDVVKQVGKHAPHVFKVPPRKILQDPYFNQSFVKPIDENIIEKRAYFTRIFSGVKELAPHKVVVTKDDIGYVKTPETDTVPDSEFTGELKPGDHKVVTIEDRTNLRTVREEITVGADGTVIEKTGSTTNRWPQGRIRFNSGPTKLLDVQQASELSPAKRLILAQQRGGGVTIPMSPEDRVRLGVEQGGTTHQPQSDVESGHEKPGRVIVTKGITPKSIHVDKPIPRTEAEVGYQGTAELGEIHYMKPEEVLKAQEDFRERFGNEALAKFHIWQEEVTSENLRPGLKVSENDGIVSKTDELGPNLTLHMKIAGGTERSVDGPTPEMMQSPYVRDALHKIDREYRKNFFDLMRQHKIGEKGRPGDRSVSAIDPKTYVDSTHAVLVENAPTGVRIWPFPDDASIFDFKR